jgi:hypothetical protein
MKLKETLAKKIQNMKKDEIFAYFVKKYFTDALKKNL